MTELKTRAKLSEYQTKRKECDALRIQDMQIDARLNRLTDRRNISVSYTHLKHSESKKIHISPERDPIVDCLTELTKIEKLPTLKSVLSASTSSVATSAMNRGISRIVYQHYQFYLTPNGFFNSDGQSLEDFMSQSSTELANKILTLPYFERNGALSE